MNKKIIIAIAAIAVVAIVCGSIYVNSSRNSEEVLTEEVEVLDVDFQAPVIEGEESYEFEVGSTISYKQLVTVTDDSDEDVSLEIDNSQVEINVAGEYTVVYTATDYAGNITTKEVVIIISEKETEEIETEEIETEEIVTEEIVTEEIEVVEIEESSTESNTSDSSISTSTVEEKANEILATIITDGMSLEEKAEAIYTWCYSKISYNGVNNASSWTEAAYIGMTTRAGNCYTYYSTARMLLTQAGITNMTITSSNHYWNLVDVGSGWLHFDTTYCSDGVQICLWTDAQLTAYVETGSKVRHVYDASSYPEIN